MGLRDCTVRRTTSRPRGQGAPGFLVVSRAEEGELLRGAGGQAGHRIEVHVRFVGGQAGAGAGAAGAYGGGGGRRRQVGGLSLPVGTAGRGERGRQDGDDAAAAINREERDEWQEFEGWMEALAPCVQPAHWGRATPPCLPPPPPP